MTTNTTPMAHWGLPLPDTKAELLVHPGEIAPVRISAFRAAADAVWITASHEQPLDELVRGVLSERKWTGASGELESGTLRAFSFSYPIPGPDETSRVALSPPEFVERAAIEHGGLTVGSREGNPLVHTHAVFTDTSGERRGGHLHYDSVVVGQGTRIRLWGTSEVLVDSTIDQEIGVPIFQFSGEHGMENDDPERSRNAVFARIKPNVDLTHALEILLELGCLEGEVLVPGQIGSLVGTVFSDPSGLRRIEGPVVEVLQLRPSLRREGETWHATLWAEIVDSRGRLHSGVLARGLNPVCMTFELGLFAQNT